LLINPAEHRVVRIALRDGIYLYVDPAVDLQETIFWTGEYDRPVIRRMKQLLPPGAVALDVGANIGAYSVQLGRALQDGGRLIAIEPVPANVKRLRENVEVNGLAEVIEIVETAVGDRHGVVRLRGADSARGVAGNAVVADSGVAASLTTIDSIAEQYALERCDLMKLDIEGCEYAALRGAERLLRRFRPVLYLELNAHWMSHFGWTVYDLLNYLEPLGYDLVNERGESLRTATGRAEIESAWAWQRGNAYGNGSRNRKSRRT